jgi:hypothetical protein
MQNHFHGVRNGVHCGLSKPGQTPLCSAGRGCRRCVRRRKPRANLSVMRPRCRSAQPARVGRPGCLRLRSAEQAPGREGRRGGICGHRERPMPAHRHAVSFGRGCFRRCRALTRLQPHIPCHPVAGSAAGAACCVRGHGAAFGLWRQAADHHAGAVWNAEARIAPLLLRR